MKYSAVTDSSRFRFCQIIIKRNETRPGDRFEIGSTGGPFPTWNCHFSTIDGRTGLCPTMFKIKAIPRNARRHMARQRYNKFAENASPVTIYTYIHMHVRNRCNVQYVTLSTCSCVYMALISDPLHLIRHYHKYSRTIHHRFRTPIANTMF